MADSVSPSAASHVDGSESETVSPLQSIKDLPPPGEGCPTPLAWQQVLEQYRTDRVESQVDTVDGPIQLWEFGQGEPLYLIGGAAGNGDLFCLLAWLLREDRQTVVVQFPEEIPVAAGQLTSRLGEHFTTLLRERSAVGAPVLATGYGGAITLQTAVQSPQLVGPMMLQGTSPGVQWSTVERLMLGVGRHLPGQLRHLPTWARLAAANHQPWFPPFDPSRWEFLLQNLGQTNTREFARRCAAWRDLGLSDRFHELTQPILIIRTEGEGSPLTKGQEALAQLLPESKTEWMHSSGQFPHVTHPHRIVKLIKDFLLRAQ
ncbi:MAG: alpha/beta hydrolase [Planctomycetaceae bacterium]